MSNKFEIILSARDKFTAAFTKLEKTAGKTNRALGVGEKTSDRTAKNTDVWAKSMERVTRAATSSVSALKDAASPLEAMGALRFGGAAGGVVALAAGAVLLTQKWASQTTEMARTSQAADISAETMQVWSAAAKAAGFSGDMMARSLVAVSTAMYDINQQLPKGDKARMLFQVLGIDPTKKIESVFPEFLAKMREAYRNPITRGNAAELIGMDREIALLIEKLPDLQAAIQKQKALGAAQSRDAIAQAEAQVVALGNLENAWKRVFNATGAAMSPAAVKMLDWMSGSTGAPNPTPGKQGAGSAKPWAPWLMDLLRGEEIMGSALPKRFDSRGMTSTLDMDPANGSLSFEDAIAGKRLPGGGGKPLVLPHSGAAADAELNSALGYKGSPVRVEVSFVNAPAGTTASARLGDQQVPVRISHSMPTGRTP